MENNSELISKIEELFSENLKLTGMLLKILDARTKGKALIPDDIYEYIVKHLNLEIQTKYF
jgi:hypothetical protein